MDIKVDLSKYNLNQLNSQVDIAIQSAVSVSLAVVRDKWISKTQSSLNSTRPAYLLGLDMNSIVYPYEKNPFSGAVVLHGKFPNMLEQGFPAFDEKIGFSKSSRKITSKDGKNWYLTVPMRHSTPSAFMYGRPMPQSIYKQAKQLQDRESLKDSSQPKTSWTGYQHKSSIYNGLTRIIKSYINPITNAVTKQSQYMTFRRVSSKSDSSSWWHPGYQGVHIAKSLQSEAQSIFEHNIELYIKNIK